MSKSSERRFEVHPDEYVAFRFSVRRAGFLSIQMYATSPVNLLLMEGNEYLNYKNGNESYSIDRWDRRINLENQVEVWAGTWYIVIEGRDTPSGGWLMVDH